jgi:hypothetical protein
MMVYGDSASLNSVRFFVKTGEFLTIFFMKCGEGSVFQWAAYRHFTAERQTPQKASLALPSSSI